MVNRIDIGNVRGIKGEKGEKGDKGNTPSYNDLKYAKENNKFVTLKGVGKITQYFVDVQDRLCDEEGHILGENFNPTDEIGEPFDFDEFGYEYRPVWIDSEGNFTNESGELLDEFGNVQYATSDFISDITSYIYSDKEGYEKLVTDISPYVTDTLISADPNDEKYRAFFDEIEGDIKYYICDDNPKTSIVMENDELKNTCKYYDNNGELVTNNNGECEFVPLEKNTLYLYNNHGVYTNDIMHYDIYLCKKANTVPIKLVSSNDFIMDYNVIDDLKIDVEDVDNDNEDDVVLKLVTRGTRGQFYSMSDVDTLFDNNVISKLGKPEGIAQLNSAGKIPSSQLPTHIDDVIEGTMNSSETVFTPSNSSENNLVEQKSKIYLDINSKKSYRWSGSIYVYLGDYEINLDDELNIASGNPVKNSVITSEINSINNNKVNSLSNSNSTTYPTTNAVTTALSSKENTSNKSNSIYDPNTSHYPTCKAVLDGVDDVFNVIGTDDYLRGQDVFEVDRMYSQEFMAKGISKTLLEDIVDDEGIYKVQKDSNIVSRDLYYYYDGEKIYCLTPLKCHLSLSSPTAIGTYNNYNLSVNQPMYIVTKLTDNLGNPIGFENVRLNIEGSIVDILTYRDGETMNDLSFSSKGIKRIFVESDYLSESIFVLVS